VALSGALVAVLVVVLLTERDARRAGRFLDRHPTLPPSG
jgi:hypothetical protein